MTDSSDPPDIAASHSAAPPAARDRHSDASNPTTNVPPNQAIENHQTQHAQHSEHALNQTPANRAVANPGQDLDKPAAKPDGGDPPPSSHRQFLKPGRRTTVPQTSTDSDQNVIGGAASRNESTGDVLEKNNHNGNDGTASDALAQGPSPSRFQRIVAETRRSTWLVVTHSWLNALLVFIPVGIIAAEVPGIHAAVIFSTNAVAIIPLAGLLAFATESVAAKMGDALGALLNVTFGNAVELIIFIIALAQNKIRIVQASLLGSILANLLLILGMGFFLGGLRYREQVYNSTVTQMSACLLSLSVVSLVLPTAFHASFSDPDKADAQSLKISRGTSVILLLVYGIYLLFQLKSHAYLYESTPQHIVDAEAIPGPAAGWLDSSSDSDSSSSSSDSSDSDHSRDTMKRKMKKVLRGGRRRKSSVNSAEISNMHLPRDRSSSFVSVDAHAIDEQGSITSSIGPSGHKAGEGQYDTADEDASYRRKRRFSRKKQKKDKKRRAREARAASRPDQASSSSADGNPAPGIGNGVGEPRRVDFAVPAQGEAQTTATTDGTPAAGARRPFPGLRGMSVKNLAPPVFVPTSTEPVAAQSGSVPRVRYGIRRTNSLPDLNQQQQYPFRPPGAMLPAQIPLASLTGGNGALEAAAGDEDVDNGHLTKWASVVLLLITTGLVAFCAELLVSSIEDVTSSSNVGEIFIGLIILPIVGNAAEHVTAITVAMKNKMDLAIGVAVGSSIQIAIFITPLVVILGWIMDKEMTLYFTLFETVCLFVSAFIVNFLVLDGRSNYLEGALLCAVYLIISVVAFFYPDVDEASQLGD